MKTLNMLVVMAVTTLAMVIGLGTKVTKISTENPDGIQSSFVSIEIYDFWEMNIGKQQIFTSLDVFDTYINLNINKYNELSAYNGFSVSFTIGNNGICYINIYNEWNIN